MYKRLFKHKNPEDTNEVPGGFLTDIADNTLETRKGLADKSILGSKVEHNHDGGKQCNCLCDIILGVR